MINFKELDLDKLSKVAANIELWDDRILVKKMEIADKTTGGIVIAEETKENNPPRLALVLGVGPGRPDYNMRSSVGESVIISQYAGSEFKDPFTEEVVYIIRESDIIGRYGEGRAAAAKPKPKSAAKKK